MNPLDLLKELINEHGSAAIQKERLTLLREQMEQLQKERDRFEQENQALKAKVYDLQQELEKQSVPADFSEYRGVLIRRRPDGKVEPDAYCPTCKVPMVSFHGQTPFRCSKCKLSVGLTGRELKFGLKGDDGEQLVVAG